MSTLHDMSAPQDLAVELDPNRTVLLALLPKNGERISMRRLAEQANLPTWAVLSALMGDCTRGEVLFCYQDDSFSRATRAEDAA